MSTTALSVRTTVGRFLWHRLPGMVIGALLFAIGFPLFLVGAVICCVAAAVYPWSERAREFGAFMEDLDRGDWQ
jgi:hypothetical protein